MMEEENLERYVNNVVVDKKNNFGSEENFVTDKSNLVIDKEELVMDEEKVINDSHATYMENNVRGEENLVMDNENHVGAKGNLANEEKNLTEENNVSYEEDISMNEGNVENLGVNNPAEDRENYLTGNENLLENEESLASERVNISKEETIRSDNEVPERNEEKLVGEGCEGRNHVSDQTIAIDNKDTLREEESLTNLTSEGIEGRKLMKDRKEGNTEVDKEEQESDECYQVKAEPLEYEMDMECASPDDDSLKKEFVKEEMPSEDLLHMMNPGKWCIWNNEASNDQTNQRSDYICWILFYLAKLLSCRNILKQFK